MPIVGTGENKNDFMGRCIPILIDEGKTQEQAQGQCNGIYEQSLKGDKKKMKTVTVDGFESPSFGEDLSEKGIDILGSTYANCRTQWVKDHPKDRENKANKTSCSKIAWNAVKEAGEMKMKLETAGLEDVEIAQEGTFKDMHGRLIEFTQNKFDEFIQNFNNKVFPPVLTINHSPKETKDMQSFMRSINLGTVSKVFKKGKSLFVNFKGIPKKLAELIDAGLFKFRSMEFFNLFKHANGGLFKNVIIGVTFHGGADGSSAITTLSDTFRLFKEKSTEQLDEEEIISVEMKFDAKEDLNMSKIEIDKTEYESLLKNNEAFKELKTESDTKGEEITTLKTDNEKLTTEGEEKDKKIEEAEKFKTDVEKEKEETLKAEADAWGKEQVKLKKIKPKYLEDEVENYIRLKSSTEEGSEDKFNRFKEKIETGEDVVNLGEVIKDDDGNDIPSVNELKTKEDEERMAEAVENLIKSKGMTEAEAMVELKLMTPEEAGIKSKEVS